MAGVLAGRYGIVKLMECLNPAGGEVVVDGRLHQGQMGGSSRSRRESDHQDFRMLCSESSMGAFLSSWCSCYAARARNAVRQLLLGIGENEQIFDTHKCLSSSR